MSILVRGSDGEGEGVGVEGAVGDRKGGVGLRHSLKIRFHAAAMCVVLSWPVLSWHVLFCMRAGESKRNNHVDCQTAWESTVSSDKFVIWMGSRRKRGRGARGH